MIIEDAYAELGLAPGAGEVSVKAAWRRLVSQWHPDRNPTASALARMQRINAAYEQLRYTGFEPAAAEASPTSAAPTARGAARAVHTIRRRLRLTLEEAALGCTKVLRGKLMHPCTACDGRGDRVLARACEPCGGRGVVQQRAWYGWLSTVVTCDACAGEGVAREPCDVCDGTGRHVHSVRHAARIDAGVRNGDVLHVVADEAIAFELRVELTPHKLFVLGEDGVLRCEVPVDGFAWTAGRWMEVPTLTGMQQMRARRGHHVYRLRGQGFPSERGGPRGDYVVTLAPVFPESLSAEQEALLDRLIATTKDGALGTWGRKVQAWNRAAARGRTGAASS